MYTQESRRSQSPSSGLRPTQPANTPTRHLNQCQVEAEEVRVQSSSFHNIEDVLVCISAWKSWMPLYLPHFRGPLVSVASLNVTSLHSCPSSLHPASLTRTENEVQLFNISVEGTKLLILNWAHPRGNTLCDEEVHSAMMLSSPSCTVGLQLNYFSKLGYVICCQRHSLWVNKLGFWNCLLTSLIFPDIIPSSSLIPFLGCLLISIFHVQKVHSSSLPWC